MSERKDEDREDVKVPKQRGEDEEERDEPSIDEHHERLKLHDDRLTTIEKALGIHHKADEMRSEEGKKEPSYRRKRH